MIKQHDDFFKRSQAAQIAAMQMQGVQITRSISKPLTDEQINSLADKVANEALVGPVLDFRVRFARAIERAHGITE
jgi:ribosomal protein S13